MRLFILALARKTQLEVAIGRPFLSQALAESFSANRPAAGDVNFEALPRADDLLAEPAADSGHCLKICGLIVDAAGKPAACEGGLRAGGATARTKNNAAHKRLHDAKYPQRIGRAAPTMRGVGARMRGL